MCERGEGHLVAREEPWAAKDAEAGAGRGRDHRPPHPHQPSHLHWTWYFPWDFSKYFLMDSQTPVSLFAPKKATFGQPFWWKRKISPLALLGAPWLPGHTAPGDGASVRPQGPFTAHSMERRVFLNIFPCGQRHPCLCGAEMVAVPQNIFLLPLFSLFPPPAQIIRNLKPLNRVSPWLQHM